MSRGGPMPHWNVSLACKLRYPFPPLRNRVAASSSPPPRYVPSPGFPIAPGRLGGKTPITHVRVAADLLFLIPLPTTKSRIDEVISPVLRCEIRQIIRATFRLFDGPLRRNGAVFSTSENRQNRRCPLGEFLIVPAEIL